MQVQTNTAEIMSQNNTESLNDNRSGIVIAIDGFSSSGKSTMARALASRLGYRYIDSGAMYRAVTLYALEHNLVSHTEGSESTIDVQRISAALPGLKVDFAIQSDGSQHTTLNGRDIEREIRGKEVSENVSPVAAIPAVRHALTARMQEMGRQKGIVMDGRDIGTTVFPDAELKIYVNAPARTRAERRYKELQEKGIAMTFDEVLANVEERDRIDSTRKESPLRRADDAIDLDNSNMTISQQNAWLDNIVRQTLNKLSAK